MAKRYYELMEDVHVPGRWYPGAIVRESQDEQDPSWLLLEGRPLSFERRLRVPLYISGRALDFAFTDVRVPLLHERVARVFTRLAPEDVQLFPVDIEGQSEPYFTLNATHLIRCIDDQRCAEVEYWKPEDGRPEKVGQYRAVAEMRIDYSKVGNAQVFRPWGWTVVLIVSEEIKQALEELGATGMRFEEV